MIKTKIAAIAIGLIGGCFPLIALGATFSSGQTVQAASNLNVRSSASVLAAFLGTEPAGATGTTTDGPITAGGYTWWKLSWSNGLAGWSVGDYLVPAATGTVLSASATSCSVSGNLTSIQVAGINSDLAKMKTMGLTTVRILTITRTNPNDPVLATWNHEIFLSFPTPTTQELNNFKEYLQLIDCAGMMHEIVLLMPDGKNEYNDVKIGSDPYIDYNTFIDSLWPVIWTGKMPHLFVGGDISLATTSVQTNPDKAPNGINVVNSHRAWLKAVWSHINTKYPGGHYGVELYTEYGSYWDQGSASARWLRDNLRPLPAYLGFQLYPTSKDWLVHYSPYAIFNGTSVDWDKLTSDWLTHVTEAAGGIPVVADEIGMDLATTTCVANCATATPQMQAIAYPFTAYDQYAFMTTALHRLASDGIPYNVWEFADEPGLNGPGAGYFGLYGRTAQTGVTAVSMAASTLNPGIEYQPSGFTGLQFLTPASLTLHVCTPNNLDAFTTYRTTCATDGQTLTIQPGASLSVWWSSTGISGSCTYTKITGESLSAANNNPFPGWGSPSTKSGDISISCAYPWGNTLRSTVHVLVRQPDLTATSATAISAGYGLTYVVSAAVKNTGTGGTANSTDAYGNGTKVWYTRFDRATDAAGSNAQVMFTMPFGQYGESFSAGASVTFNKQYTFPATGTYYVRACADHATLSDSGIIAESNEGNNCSTSWTPVIVSSGTNLGNFGSVTQSGSSSNAFGWACLKGSATPINVHVYVIDPATGAQVGTTVATNQPISGVDQTTIDGLCNSTGNMYRFSIPLTSAMLQYPGKLVHVDAISSAGTTALPSSTTGSFTIPSTPSVPTALPWAGMTKYSGTCGTLSANTYMVPGQSVTSCTTTNTTHTYTFVFQLDGNVVLYKDAASTTARRALWATNTEKTSAAYLVMRPNGDLAVYTASGTILWSSSTHGGRTTTGTTAHLQVQLDGNLVIYTDDATHASLWASNTVQPLASAAESQLASVLESLTAVLDQISRLVSGGQ